jgi:putative ABC transport system permease protein
MKTRDVFSYSFSAIKLRKLRAGLTTLGVVIGIAAIVALLSITQGLQDTISAQLQKGFATDTLIVSTGRGFGIGAMGGVGGVNSGFKLFVNDTQTINEIENVTMSTAVIERTGSIKFGKTVWNVTIVGVDFTKYASIYSSTFVAESGEIPQNPDNETIVIGKRVSDPWKNGTLIFNASDVVEVVWLNATVRPPEYENYTGHIEGVLKEIGGFGIVGPSDYNIYIPISQAQKFFGTNECDMIVVKLNSDNKVIIDSVSQAIVEAFDNQASVTSSTAVLDILSSVISTVQFFLAGIAAISLLVAGIGIMNIMIVSLIERTREIGILKALGMKSRTVLFIFLSEAAIIGLMGAAIGIGSGWILANLIAILFTGRGAFMQSQEGQSAVAGGMSITPVLTPLLLLGALAFGLIVSVVFALYPAWRASRLKPVEALRYE